jgi:hypothetical protein
VTWREIGLPVGTLLRQDSSTASPFSLLYDHKSRRRNDELRIWTLLSLEMHPESHGGEDRAARPSHWSKATAGDGRSVPVCGAVHRGSVRRYGLIRSMTIALVI